MGGNGLEKTTLQVVLEAVQDLHNMEQVVTRETLRDATGLRLTVIDDRISLLIDNGQVYRVQRGVFVPAPEHKPARLITKTVLPCGTVKIEIGDDHVLTLTPREDRMLARLMAGSAQELSSVEMGHQTAILNGQLTGQIRELRRKLAKFEDQLSKTGSLFGSADQADQ